MARCWNGEVAMASDSVALTGRIPSHRSSGLPIHSNASEYGRCVDRVGAGQDEGVVIVLPARALHAC